MWTAPWQNKLPRNGLKYVPTTLAWVGKSTILIMQAQYWYIHCEIVTASHVWLYIASYNAIHGNESSIKPCLRLMAFVIHHKPLATPGSSSLCLLFTWHMSHCSKCSALHGSAANVQTLYTATNIPLKTWPQMQPNTTFIQWSFYIQSM